MTRREIREQIFQILFGVEFHTVEELNEQMELALDRENMKAEDYSYITEKLIDICQKTQQIDAAINATAKGWKTSRMGKVDLTLIRLAVYEIRYEESIPTKVSINEAVELAKKYGNDGTPAFVNGVLAKFA